MNVIKSRFVYHLMAIITVAIWGTTFVSTKILIQHGLSPSDIFFYRFTLAYLCMWCISYKKLFANRVKDEFIIRKSKFPQNPKRSVRFSGKRTKRSVQKRKARNTQKAETKVL